MTFLRGEHRPDGAVQVVTGPTGEHVEVAVRRRVVDATYLAPTVPATTPPPFSVDDDARVVPVNDLVFLGDVPTDRVIVGSGKTATDAIVWLLGTGVDPDLIRLQTIRAGFPCFCAALAGYVEATRDDDRERNRLCPPNVYGNTLADFARMQVRGARAVAAYGAEEDIAAWADGCLLNPTRVGADERDDPALQAASARLAEYAEAGLRRMAALAPEPA